MFETKPSRIVPRVFNIIRTSLMLPPGSVEQNKQYNLFRPKVMEITRPPFNRH